MSRVVNDDRSAFEDGFDDLFARACRLATRLLGNPTLGEDMAAEALARTWLHWPKVRKLEYRQAWVLRVTTNLCLDLVRHKHLEVVVATSRDPADAVAVRLALVAALRSLPRRQREVVVLRHLADMPETQVADMLGINPGTVGAHLHRGLVTLRGCLRDPEELRLAAAAVKA